MTPPAEGVTARPLPLLAGIVLLAVLIGGCTGQSPEPSGGPEDAADARPPAGVGLSEQDVPVTLGYRQVVRSELLGEDRELSIYLPNGYGSSESQRYPLWLILDGRMSFTPTASMIHTLSEGGAIPRMIVVGVSNTNRWRDLTPVPGMGVPGTGGGDAFLASLASEIIPYIDASWRTNGFRVFSGHSLGGITTLHALHKMPEQFDAYVALSPSLEWDDGSLIEDHREFLGAKPSLEKMLYLAIADEQMERPYYERLVQLLREEAPPELIWRSDIFERYDDHNSIRVTGGLAGIRWVFRDWRLTSNRIYSMTEQEIEQHYARATLRYKQSRTLTMMEITDAGYWGLYSPESVDRAMEFFHLAIAKWPDHPYPYSCLGEGYERTGHPEQALEQMERALQMATDTGVNDLPYYQGMVDRVRSTLRR